MTNEFFLIGCFVITSYGGLFIITALLTIGRTYHLRVDYHQLRTPITKPLEQIPHSSLHDTQELKPVLRKIVSIDTNLYIEPDSDSELEARTQAEIHRHKHNLKRIIEHITSPPLAS